MSVVHEQIQHFVDSNRVALFMKGTREQPQCGFSAQVVQILDSLGTEYETLDVLADWDLREGIKAYSNWPTIPQLYVGGQFVGGCDITMQLHRRQELGKLIEQAGKEAP